MVNLYELRRCFYELGVTHLGLEKYDLIHTQDVLSTTCMNRIRPKRTTLVATLHGCVAYELKQATQTSNLASTYFDKLEFDGATSAEITIVANEWLKNILTSEFHVPEKQLKVFHYGYETESFLNRIKESPSIPHPVDKKVIIYTGRLTELKGVHHLITALSQLKRIRNDWVGWIVGDGSKRVELQAQTLTLGLEQDVFFFGRRDDIPYLLSISDIFVLPTLFENQPLSVIEAQISGKPVIASDVGGVPEMIDHGVTGVLTPAGDPRMLCININYLLEHEPYRKNLGANAQKWGLDHWDPDKAVKNVLAVYESAISQKIK